MSRTPYFFLAAILLCASQPGLARQAGDTAAERAAAERKLELAAEEVERAAEAVRRAMTEQEGERDSAAADAEIEMREAESRLAAAARQVAELSAKRLPGTVWSAAVVGKPVLGVSIGGRDDGEPVAGVEIIGVSPGGAAAEARLRAGDVITAVNGEQLAADSAREANRKLLAFMAGVEEGDRLQVDYRRNGKPETVTIEPRPLHHGFDFDRDFSIGMVPAAPGVPGLQFDRHVFVTDGHGLGDMEMVSLTEGLGRYFGTEEGVLVVRAPKDAETYKLEDGDVILDIDGRQPMSVSHAVRILASYQAGETLAIRIMRDQRERTLEIEVPQQHTGARFVPVPPAPPAAPKPPQAGSPEQS